MDSSFHFYTIKDEYVQYLRKFDSKVHYQYKDNASTYVGIVLVKNNFNYFVPLSSYSKKNPTKDKRMKERDRIVIRLFELGNLNNPLGYLLFNNMIPVPNSELLPIVLDLSISKHKMMSKQIIFMKAINDKIHNKAETVYRKSVFDKDKYYVNFCCDFKILEAKAILYTKGLDEKQQ
ncbi:MAG TPA: type III toxin-antitoxin system ToxN/AbiQ family toxin [Bavariicoccus seileri]|uniref:Type III toxin-antitoxin system ToxN/AbiQ family toxin n=1 Tax=Bavariicoccus seileri TaxID=549685 RepID=A0A3D4S5B0_9ENTE|nr:type III toxin-antitoxin system ToxN/AbiQ family toxin [Bavariicoccus seileri]HCS93141.1 type III toxin-antitoxin system ToxN/AbiQ family toxin [Bavariicoccus seileri]